MADAMSLAAAIPEIVGTHDLDTRPLVDLTHDSRLVDAGWAFACVRGESFDGHDFAADAVGRGATLLITERRLGLGVPEIVVADCRRALGPAAAAVHDHPADRLVTIGVTGTNGKTTTTHLLGAVLRGAGLQERQVGTLTGARTTPEAPELQRRLASFVADGAQAVAMEVSSHALTMHRVDGMTFDVAVFTNLGHDHLDLHGTVEAYFRAKAELFTPALASVGVSNVDDLHGRLLVDGASIPMVGYSVNDVADLEVSATAHSYTWRGRRVQVPVGGRFNVDNSLAALTAAAVLDLDLDGAVRGLAEAPPVPGRFELVEMPSAGQPTVIVDYAHTPDGIREVLAAARPLGERVVVVVGCGGDRDREKRPRMGDAAATGADAAYITSDNPRSEDPLEIIEMTVAGIAPTERHRVTVEPDRRAAIAAAIGAAGPHDVVVIAGKGHETTQTIGTVSHPFDDRVVARAVLAELRTTGTPHP